MDLEWYLVDTPMVGRGVAVAVERGSKQDYLNAVISIVRGEAYFFYGGDLDLEVKYNEPIPEEWSTEEVHAWLEAQYHLNKP